MGRVERVATGTPIARLHLPTISQTLVVVEGADERQLDKGPGRMAEHRARSVQTGQHGAVPGTGTRASSGTSTCLEAGDPVVVETAGTWLVYRAVRTVIVEPVDETVLAAARARRARPCSTLITCEPKLSTAQPADQAGGADAHRSQVRPGAAGTEGRPPLTVSRS